MFGPTRTRRGGAQAAQTGRGGQPNAEICPPVRCITGAEAPTPGCARGQAPVSPQLGARQTRRRKAACFSMSRFAKEPRRPGSERRPAPTTEGAPSPRQRKRAESPAHANGHRARTSGEDMENRRREDGGAPRRCGEKSRRGEAALNSQGPYQQRKRGKHSL